MSCKLNNSLYTTIPKEIEEYELFDIYEEFEEPIEDFDYSYAEVEAKEFAYIEFLISKYGGYDK